MCTKQFGMHSMLLNVGIDGCTAIQRDGNIVELGTDTAELRRLIEGELLSLQVACLAGLVRYFTEINEEVFLTGIKNHRLDGFKLV
jgi:hypothetical protein